MLIDDGSLNKRSKMKALLLLGVAVAAIALFIFREEAARFVNSTKNGSQNMLFEQDPTLLTTTVRVVFRTGALSDPAGKSGLANLMGEMLLRGTKQRNREQFQSEIERMGAQVGVRVSHDSVVVAGEVIKENTGKFFQLISEAILQPAFDAKEFTSLKEETLAEINHAKNSNGRLAGLALRRAMFGGTPLAYPTVGSLKSVQTLVHGDLATAYPALIHKGGILIGVSSALPAAEMRPALEALVSKLPDGKASDVTSVAPKTLNATDLIVVHKPKTSTGSILMGQAGITATDPQRYALGVANFSFGGEPLVSRLFKVIRSELGYTYAIGTTYSTMGPLSNQQGIFVISTTPTSEFTTKTLLKLRSMWADYLEKGATHDELNLAHESLVNSYPFEFDSADKRLSKKMYEQMYNVPVLNPEQYQKTIRAVDNKAVLTALKERHSMNNWVITMVADANELEKQLAAEQKDIPENERFKIKERLEPDTVIQ